MIEATSRNMVSVEVPRFQADGGLDPFDVDTRLWKDGPRLLHKICLLVCPFRTVAEWQERLNEAEQIIRTNPPNPSIPVASAVVGEGATQRFEVGLAFTLINSVVRSEKYSQTELEASVALWFLVRAVVARQGGDDLLAEHYEKQSLWCLLQVFSSRGEKLGVRMEKKRRSISSSVGGKKRAQPTNQRIAAAISEYRNAEWVSKNEAAEELAVRHSLGPRIIRKKLKGI